MMMIDAQQFVKEPQAILRYLQGLDIESSLVYLAGSLMEGFGNQTSDVDVYVVYQSEPQIVETGDNSQTESRLVEEQCLVRNITHEAIRFDFEYWKMADFMQAIERLNGLSFNTESLLNKLIPAKEFDLLHRLKYAIPLVNLERFAQVRESVEFEKLDLYGAVLGYTYFSGRLEDIQGALLSNDAGSAFFMARILLDYMVTAYISIFGETNPSPKWLYRKIERYQQKTGDESLLTRYIYLQTYPFDKSKVKEYAKEVIKYCQELNIKIQTFFYEKQKQ